MGTSSYRHRTKTIGDELARMIRDSASGSLFRVCQFGGIDLIAAPKKLKELLPAAIIEPFPKAIYLPRDGAGTESDVLEQYRIAVFFPIIATDDIRAVEATWIESVLVALRADFTLSGIGATIRPDQVTGSALVGIDWVPPEGLYLTDTDQPAQVVVLEWAVSWLNRG